MFSHEAAQFKPKPEAMLQLTTSSVINRVRITFIAAFCCGMIVFVDSPVVRGQFGDEVPRQANQPPREVSPPRRGSQQAPPGPGQRSAPGRRNQGSPLLLALDTDRDGIISPEEINNAAVALKKLDANGDGRLEPAEYRPGSARLPGRSSQGRANPPGMNAGPASDAVQQTIERLLQYDENEDGQLVPDELPSRLRSVFDRADKDGDGVLSRRELVADARDQLDRSRSGSFPKPAPSVEKQSGSGLQQQFAERLMNRLDANSDRVLEANEIPDRMRSKLMAADSNGDKKIDLTELGSLAPGTNREFTPK